LDHPEDKTPCITDPMTFSTVRQRREVKDIPFVSSFAQRKISAWFDDIALGRKNEEYRHVGDPSRSSRTIDFNLKMNEQIFVQFFSNDEQRFVHQRSIRSRSVARSEDFFDSQLISNENDRNGFLGILSPYSSRLSDDEGKLDEELFKETDEENRFISIDLSRLQQLANPCKSISSAERKEILPLIEEKLLSSFDEQTICKFSKHSRCVDH
jgi:hypothetical protein